MYPILNNNLSDLSLYKYVEFLFSNYFELTTNYKYSRFLGVKTFFSGSGPFVNRAMLVGAVQVGTYDQFRDMYKDMGVKSPLCKYSNVMHVLYVYSERVSLIRQRTVVKFSEYYDVKCYDYYGVKYPEFFRCLNQRLHLFCLSYRVSTGRIVYICDSHRATVYQSFIIQLNSLLL